MINVRVQTDSVKSIIGATTDELRAIYRPIKNYEQDAKGQALQIT